MVMLPACLRSPGHSDDEDQLLDPCYAATASPSSSIPDVTLIISTTDDSAMDEEESEESADDEQDMADHDASSLSDSLSDVDDAEEEDTESSSDEEDSMDSDTDPRCPIAEPATFGEPPASRRCMKEGCNEWAIRYCPECKEYLCRYCVTDALKACCKFFGVPIYISRFFL